MINIELNIKPLSVNDCWQGKRYKTEAYKNYEKSCLALLPKKKINPKAKLEVTYIFYFSNNSSDVGNPEKPLSDILQKKYFFDDKNIYKLTLIKKIVKKGQEKIEIKIKEIDESI